MHVGLSLKIQFVRAQTLILHIHSTQGSSNIQLDEQEELIFFYLLLYPYTLLLNMQHILIHSISMGFVDNYDVIIINVLFKM